MFNLNLVRFIAFQFILMFSATAQAAIAVNLDPEFLLPTGEIFLAVYDSESGASYTRDLGVNSSFTNYDTLELSFPPDALYSSTFGQSDPSNLRYSVVAIAFDSFNQQDIAWTTSNDSNVGFPTDAQLTMQIILGGVNDYVSAVNESIPTTDINENLSTLITDVSSEGHYTNPSTFNESLASVVFFNTGAPIGTSLDFYSMSYNYGLQLSSIELFENQWRLSTDGTLTYGPPLDTDTDTDGIPDSLDNCIQVANPSQIDTDNDGFGNICDTDLNGDCITNFIDLGLFGDAFLSTTSSADFNDDGIANFIDLVIFQENYLMPPGPSASATCQ